MSESAAERNLRHRICDFLRTHAVQRVNFRFGRAFINGSMFESVALRLQDWHSRTGSGSFHASRPIRVRIHSLPANVDAEYDQRQNRITLRTSSVDSTDRGRATILHECAHAAHDVSCTRHMAHPEESVSFISEYVWYRAVNRIQIPSGEVEQVAYELSARVHAQQGYSFTIEEQRRMNAAVSRVYSPSGVTSSTNYGMNGVPIR